MHFVEILGSKLKQQINKNFNEIALIFRHPSMPFMEIKNDKPNKCILLRKTGILMK